MAQMNGIGSSTLLQTLLAQADAVSGGKNARTAAAGVAASTVSQDSTAVSTSANVLLRSSANDDVRLDKVQEVQAAIASGTYSVSASDVADKLMQSLLR